MTSAIIAAAFVCRQGGARVAVLQQALMGVLKESAVIVDASPPAEPSPAAVSYTHLTLPTICSV
eukprot:7131869-Alexandrium_andersonii.AAC.1